MKLTKATYDKKEVTIPLKESKCGDCIRFAHDSFEEALKSDLFWLRIETPELKDRVRLVNLKDGKQLERDGDHRVIIENATLHLG